MAGERIIEALDLADAEIETFREYEEAKRKGGLAGTVAPPPRNPVLAAYDVEPEEWVLKVVEKVPGTALYDALLVLPFSALPALFTFIALWVRRGWNVTLTCRVLFLALRAHHRQLVAARGPLRTDLERLRRGLRAALTEHKHRLGFNLAALRVVDRQILDAAVKDYVDDTWDDDAGDGGDQKKKKRAFVHVS